MNKNKPTKTKQPNQVVKELTQLLETAITIIGMLQEQNEELSSELNRLSDNSIRQLIVKK